jgi:hypothetical protein
VERRQWWANGYGVAAVLLAKTLAARVIQRPIFRLRSKKKEPSDRSKSPGSPYQRHSYGVVGNGGNASNFFSGFFGMKLQKVSRFFQASDGHTVANAIGHAQNFA